MAEHAGEHDSVVETVKEKITEKFHSHDSSSSDSDDDSKDKKPSSKDIKAKIYRLFGREKPVHKVLGGGKRTELSYSSYNSLNFCIYTFNYVNLRIGFK